MAGLNRGSLQTLGVLLGKYILLTTMLHHHFYFIDYDPIQSEQLSSVTGAIAFNSMEEHQSIGYRITFVRWYIRYR
jgi:hypothetical protein